MADTRKRRPFVMLLLSLLGLALLVVGWAIFAQYRAPQAGLAL